MAGSAARVVVTERQWAILKEDIKRGIISIISESHIGRYLKEDVLRPHRRKMWLNTTEKDPVVFTQGVSAVCETDHEAPARYAADGTRTVCTDEMTGLQALQRGAPDKPPQMDQVAKQEFEYTRHGTTTFVMRMTNHYEARSPTPWQLPE